MTARAGEAVAIRPASGPGIVQMSGLRFAWPGAQAFSISVEDFSLRAGERVLLIGPSGSGKSTFLSLLAGILIPDEGRLDVLGTDMKSLSRSARDRFRADHFGIIFQMFNLLPYASLLDNVALPLSFAKERRKRVEAVGGADTEAKRLLAKLGLDAAALANAKAASLSVGQQQRVAAARALIGRPELIVADEPTSALDRDSQIAFLDLLSAETAAAGSTLVMVSHDQSLGTRFDRVLSLTDIAVTGRRTRP